MNYLVVLVLVHHDKLTDRHILHIWFFYCFVWSYEWMCFLSLYCVYFFHNINIFFKAIHLHYFLNNQKYSMSSTNTIVLFVSHTISEAIYKNNKKRAHSFLECLYDK